MVHGSKSPSWEAALGAHLTTGFLSRTICNIQDSKSALRIPPSDTWAHRLSCAQLDNPGLAELSDSSICFCPYPFFTYEERLS